MSQRASIVDAAYKWGVPLHIWDGTGLYPTEEQKAEMVAYIKARQDMEAWEGFLSRPKEKGITIGE